MTIRCQGPGCDHEFSEEVARSSDGLDVTRSPEEIVYMKRGNPLKGLRPRQGRTDYYCSYECLKSDEEADEDAG